MHLSDLSKEETDDEFIREEESTFQSFSPSLYVHIHFLFWVFCHVYLKSGIVGLPLYIMIPHIVFELSAVCSLSKCIIFEVSATIVLTSVSG